MVLTFNKEDKTKLSKTVKKICRKTKFFLDEFRQRTKLNSKSCRMLSQLEEKKKQKKTLDKQTKYLQENEKLREIVE